MSGTRFSRDVPPIALTPLFDRVLSNQLSPDEAEREVARHAAAYALPAGVGGRDVEAWLGNRDALAEELTAFTERLEGESFARVVDLGRVAVAAAALLGEGAAGFASFQVGGRLQLLGATDEAIPWLERATERLAASEPDSPHAEVRLDAMRLLIHALEERGRYDRVAELAPVAADAARRAGARALEAQFLLTDAWHARGTAHRARALASARAAAALGAALDPAERDAHGVARASQFYRVLGIVARNAGQVEEALQAFAEGRRVAETAEADPAQGALLLSDIGMTWELAGEFERGQEVRELAADIAERLGHREHAARWRQRAFDEATIDDADPATQLAYVVSLTKRDAPDIDRALAIARKAARRARELGEIEVEALARNAIGSLHARRGEWTLADTALRLAVERAREASSELLELQFRTNLGRLHIEHVRPDVAEAELRAAVALGERLRAAAPTGELRQAYGAVLANAYEQLALSAAVSFTHPDGTQREPDPAALCDVASRVRAANLNAWLALGNAVEVAGDDALAARLLALREAEVRIEATSEASAVIPPELTARQTTARRALDGALAAAGIAVRHAPPTLDVLQRQLPPGTLLVDLLSLHDGVAFNAIGRDHAEATSRNWARRERERFLRRWRRALRDAAEADSDDTRSDGARNATRDRLAACWREMDERLVEPIAELAAAVPDATRMLVVPHRELFLVPYWRLARLRPDCLVSVLPSPDAYALLGARQRGAHVPRVCVGDVTGTLRLSEREIDAVAPRTVAAAEAATLFGALADAAVVHFAGHGWFDERNPYYSGLAVRAAPADARDPLAAPNPWGLADCELLTVAQLVARSRLSRAALGVLSACDTGLPRTHAASEFTSLPAALLVAGARNVIASLWPAHDGAAMLLMRALYRALDSAGGAAAVSTALAAARRTLAATSRDEVVGALGGARAVPRRDHPFDDPMYLDCFQLYGPD